MSHSTALRDHNRTVFEEMKSWTALTVHLGMGDNILDQIYVK